MRTVLREYPIEDGKPVDLADLIAKPMIPELYSAAHRSLPIICHDAFLGYQDGILLIERKEHPAKNEIWPIGGRLKRGIGIERSLAMKVEEETSLRIRSPQFLGLARHYFRTDPFLHGRGTDTPSMVFYADASGELDLSAEHGRPYVIMPTDSNPPKKWPNGVAIRRYTQGLRKELHPYVGDFLPLALRSLKHRR